VLATACTSALLDQSRKRTSEIPMSCPLLALQGADDPVVSPTACARGARRRRGSITWCPGGHFFHTDPEFLRTTLRPFVARMLAQ
jgi:surfactin synthase thioesterase subunit